MTLNDLIVSIKTFTAKNNYAPTVGELAKLHGITKSNVQYWIEAGARAGLVQHEPRKARTLRVVEGSTGLPLEN